MNKFYRVYFLTCRERPWTCSQDTKQECIDYIDEHVQVYLPDKDADPELYELVKKYQTHSHNKSCRKYKKIACRFNFGQFYTDKTIVVVPIPDDMDDEMKTATLTRRTNY